MIIQWSVKAKKDYQALPGAIQVKTDKAFRLFAQNSWHPSLHVEKIDHKRSIYSARIDRNYRFTFQWIRGGIFVRRMGSHEKAYRKP